METGYEWVPFYEELAKKIVAFRNNQPGLIALLKLADVQKGLEDESPKGTRVPLTEIDPFTFLALLNKYEGNERARRLAVVAAQLSIVAAPPHLFYGVPTSDPRNSWLFPYKYERRGDETSTLWTLFDQVLAGNVDDQTMKAALQIKSVGKAKLTQAMFWTSPATLFPIDGQTTAVLKSRQLPSEFSNATEYVRICEQIPQVFGKPPYVVSYEAWKMNQPLDKPGGDVRKVQQPVAVYKTVNKERSTSLNRILYGPPGTGKTFRTKQLAVEICDGDVPQDRSTVLARYEELRQQNRVEFVTFHQSFSYEDFVEGLRPVIVEGGGTGSLAYECRPGVFRRISAAAETALRPQPSAMDGVELGAKRVFKMSLGDTNRPDEAYLFDECMANGYVLLGYGAGLDFSGCTTPLEIANKLRERIPDIKPNDYNITSVNYLATEIKIGDLILVSDGNLEYRAIGEVTGDYEYLDRQGKDTYCQKRAVRWIRKYEESQPIDLIFNKRLSQMTVYLMDQASLKRPALAAVLAPQHARSEPNNYVLVIDEINRANISKVLGDLISLLETDKRIGAREELRVKLPYSQKEFGVPQNLYIIGTMNTADRSIALLDTALRRRFEFDEVVPDYNVLSQTGSCEISDADGVAIDLRYLLMAINDRVEFLLGRDQRIGHAYLIGIRNIADLNRAFTQQIIPLLKEYFHEDWSGVARVLSAPKGAPSMVIENFVAVREFFGAAACEDLGSADKQSRFTIAPLLSGAMYRGIYQDREDQFAARLATG